MPKARKKPPPQDRRLEPAERRDAEELLRRLHATAVLWPRCRNKRCRRMRACTGDVDECGARCFPEGWAWLRGMFRSLRDGASPAQARRVADRRLIWLEDEGTFGRKKPRFFRWYYPYFKQWFDIPIKDDVE